MAEASQEYELLPSDLIQYYTDILSPDKYIALSRGNLENTDPDVLHVEPGIVTIAK